ncbi:MAG: hypothetical protein ACYDCJ_09560 [Gammaproteobacteria bacterium]
MSSPLENLSGPGKSLRKEAADAKEFQGLKRSGLARLSENISARRPAHAQGTASHARPPSPERHPARRPRVHCLRYGLRGSGDLRRDNVGFRRSGDIHRDSRRILVGSVIRDGWVRVRLQ